MLFLENYEEVVKLDGLNTEKDAYFGGNVTFDGDISANLEPVFNVMHYGATGTGETDDTEAVEAAIEALDDNGSGILLFPQGKTFLLSPIIELSSNTHVMAYGANFVLNPDYVVAGTTFRGLFRVGSSTGTDITENVTFEGGNVTGDAFTSYVDSDPTFNDNDHKYVCFIHSVNTLINCHFRNFNTVNFGSPITLEKMGGVNGTPGRNTHCSGITFEQVWVGVQYYCNGYLYEDCSVRNITAKFCYDDVVAIVGSDGGTAGDGIAQRIQVSGIQGEKTGQAGAFVKLDATNGSLSDIDVNDVTGYTAGTGEACINIIGATQANNKKFNVWGVQSQGNWTYGFYAQTNGRSIVLSNFLFEALYDIHLQGNAVPQTAQDVKISDGVGVSRNASSADTVEGNGFSMSGGAAPQGFRNVKLYNVSFRNKSVPINEGASVPSGTGVQGTYDNVVYSAVDLRNRAVSDCDFSSTPRVADFYKDGLKITTYAQGNITGAATLNVLNAPTITATLTGDVTATITAGTYTGQTLTLILTQDGTGNRLMTWPSNFKKAGGTLTLSTTAGAVDQIVMRYNGTNWLEVSRSLNDS